MFFHQYKKTGSQRLGQIAIFVLVPVVLVLGGIRVFLSEAWVKYEYSRPTFPNDDFGFSYQEREKFGTDGIQYLVSNNDIEFLATKTYGRGPLFTQKELLHMQDVKGLVSLLRWTLRIAVVALIGISLWLAKDNEGRKLIIQTTVMAGLITLNFMLIAAVVVMLDFDVVFEEFHRVFFAPESWQFSEASTLIRLYPPRFWVDTTAALIGLVTILSGVLAIIPIGERILIKRKSLWDRLDDLIKKLLPFLR